MARPIHLLTPLDIKNSRPISVDGVARPAMLNDGGGLYLRAAPGANDSINRTWIYRYSVSGKDRQLSLGTYPDVSLAEAREKAVEQRKARGNGLDPITLRRQKERVDKAADEAKKTAAALAAARSKTFKACADEYITAHEKGWSSLHYRTRWRRTLEMFAYPLIGNLPVADVDETLVLQILEPHWKTKITTAKVLRARLAKVLGYAAARGYRPRGPNPAAWADNLNHSLPKPSQVRPTRHHPTLDYRKVGAFMMKLRQDPWIGARALEFTILTASGTDEVRSAKWSEIDLERRVWTIPKTRMKMRRDEERGDHIVPLSDAAVALLKAIKGDGEPDPSDYIFIGRFGARIATSGMLRVCQRINSNVTPHGFRSCFSDWVGDRTDASEETREFCLAHVKRGVAGAYRRATAIEKRRGLMQQWADFCNGVASDNVVLLQRTA